jgi:phosphatidate cytidylyltransferase
MFRKRIIVGILLIVGSFILIMWHPLAMAAEVLTISILGLLEFYHLAHRKGIRPSTAAGLSCGVLLLVSSYFLDVGQWAALLTVLIIYTLFVFVFRKSHHVSSFLDAGVTILGFLYIGWLFGFIIQLRKMSTLVPVGSMMIEQGACYVVFLVVATSFTDIGGFFVGKFLGRTKLCPDISPGKTVEGSIGGMAVALLAAGLWGYAVKIPLHHCLVAAMLISVFAQVGDLWESVLKRDVAVKDSGDIIAGHGGILDRFDSLFITTPIAYLYFKYLMFW